MRTLSPYRLFKPPRLKAPRLKAPWACLMALLLGTPCLVAAAPENGNRDAQQQQDLIPAERGLDQEDAAEEALVYEDELEHADEERSQNLDLADYRWTVAAKQYDAGNYDSAATLYEGLLAEGFFGFNLEFNLGNALYKSGHLGPAILHYERAARMEPRNADVQHNLELAYLRQPDKAVSALPVHPLQRFWRGWTGLLSPNGWAINALAWGVLLLIGLSMLFVSRAAVWRTRGLFVSATALLLLLGATALGWSAHRQQAKDRAVVVMAPSIVLKSAPTESSTNLYILREGYKLQLLDALDSESGTTWLQLGLADGNVGWARAGAVEEI